MGVEQSALDIVRLKDGFTKKSGSQEPGVMELRRDTLVFPASLKVGCSRRLESQEPPNQFLRSRSSKRAGRIRLGLFSKTERRVHFESEQSSTKGRVSQTGGPASSF